MASVTSTIGTGWGCGHRNPIMSKKKKKKRRKNNLNEMCWGTNGRGA
jgi:hypothetical protein